MVTKGRNKTTKVKKSYLYEHRAGFWVIAAVAVLIAAPFFYATHLSDQTYNAVNFRRTTTTTVRTTTTRSTTSTSISSTTSKSTTTSTGSTTSINGSTTSGILAAPCTYKVGKSGNDYYAENCNSSAIEFGGVNNIGNVQGTNASAVINAALRNLPPIGGDVVLLPGIYNVSTPILMGNNTVLTGTNTNATVLLAPYGPNTPIIENINGPNGNSNSQIEQLTVYGNDVPGEQGIFWYSKSYGDPQENSYVSLKVSNVYVSETGGDGIDLAQGTCGCGWDFVEDTSVTDAYGVGINLIAPDGVLENVYGTSASSTEPVLLIAGGTDTVIGGYFGGSDNSYQVELDGADDTTFLGTIIDSSAGSGLLAYGATNITYIGGEITNPSLDGNDEFSTLNFTNVQGFVFEGTKFYTNYGSYYPKSLITTTNSVHGVAFEGTMIAKNDFVNGVIAPGSIAPGSVSFNNNVGYNPVGYIAEPFGANGANTIGLAGTSNTIKASTTYLVSGVDLSAFTCSGGSGASVYEEDQSGNLVQTLSSPFTIADVPAGYQLRSNAFSSAPTCTAFGN